MSLGRSSIAIGRELYLSEDTIKTHARRLFDKIGARDRAHAVALGLAAPASSNQTARRTRRPVGLVGVVPREG